MALPYPLVPIQIQRGSNNRLERDTRRLGRLPAGFVRDVLDMRYDDAGFVSARELPELLLSFERAQGMQETADGLLIAADETLWLVRPEEGEIRRVATDIGPGPVVFAVTPQPVLWSSATRNGYVRDTVAMPLPITPPPGAFTVEAASGGGMRAGTVAVLISWIDLLGSESGTQELAEAVVVPNDGGVLVRLLLRPPPSVAQVAIWVTPVDGSRFFLFDEVPASETEVFVPFHNGTAWLETKDMQPLPPADVLQFGQGVSYAAVGHELFFSPGHAPLLSHPDDHWLFDDPVTVVAPTFGGVYVGTEQEVCYVDLTDPENPSRKVVSGQGAIKGGAVLKDAQEGTWEILTQASICSAGPGGEFSETTRPYMMWPRVYRRAAGMFRPLDGGDHVVWTCFS